MQGEIDGIPQSTKAVDIVALHKSAGLLLLEAKDFRGHRINNKTRMEGEVSVEVAVKVRDTVAALVGAARKPVDEFPSKDLSTALGGKEVMVILWLEDDTLHSAEQAKPKLNALNQTRKAKLAWLNVKTFVLSSRVPNRLPDLTVTNLRGVGQPNP